MGVLGDGLRGKHGSEVAEMVHKGEGNRDSRGHERWNLKDIIDRADRITDIFVKAGTAYVSYQATGHWTGALIGLLALRLAESNNLAAGVAGTGVLAGVGLTQLIKGATPGTNTGSPYTNRIYLPI